MPIFLVFAAGMFIGSQWGKIKKAVAPYVGNASEQFDVMYSQMAQKVGQQYEDLEDKLAENRHRANGNNHRPDGL
jgi:hypothetical protein